MVEIIPKTPKRELPWKKTSVYLTGSVLLAVVFSYFLLLNFETNNSTHLKELEEMVLQFGNTEDKELEAEAKRIVSLLPIYTPAKCNGQLVPCKVDFEFLLGTKK